MVKFSPTRSTGEDNQNQVSSHDTTSVIQIQDVPSKCIPYNKKIRIFVKTYSYREVKLLSDSRIPLDKQYEILLSGIETEGISNRDLTLHDFFWVNIYRKLSTLGVQEYKLPYTCPKCKKNGSHVFNLSDIPFNDLEAPSLPLKLSFNSIEDMEFSPITVGNYMKMVKNDCLYAKHNGEYILDANKNPIVDEISYLSSMCLSHDFDTAYELISKLTDPRDQNIIEEMDILLDHGMGVLKFNCKIPTTEAEHPSLAEHCNFELTRGLTGGESLIIPFRGDGGINKAGISFSNKGDS